MNSVECRCGKRWFPVPSAVLRDEEMERLAAMCLCKSCSADFNKAIDACPETVPLYRGRGSAACGRGWAHSGECIPAVTREEIEDAVRNTTPTKEQPNQ